MTDRREPTPMEKFRVALDLFEAGRQVRRAQIRRERPGADEVEVEARLVEWMRERPGAEFGDAEGRAVPWPRERR